MFVRWLDENDELVTQANPYIFTVSKSVTLKAQLQEVPDTATYIFEAENADLSNCFQGWQGGESGYAENHSNHNYGSSITDPESYKASNDYAAMSFNDKVGNTIKWTFYSDIDSTAILVIRMANGSWASDYSTQDMSISKTGLGMYINDTAIDYPTVTIEGKDLTDTGASKNAVFGLFTDYTIVMEMPIKTGENVFYVELLQRGSGPNIDCLKLTTSASLTWRPRADNKDWGGLVPVADYPWNITDQ